MPKKMENLIGQKFGKLTVSELYYKSDQGKTGSGKKTTWKCYCDCGNTNFRLATTNNLKRGNTKSCGCLPRLGGWKEKNLGWKGGRKQTKDGYITIRCYDYPGHKSISIGEHTYIMAKYLKRALLSHESVHHINGIKNDNRLENLELWSKHQPTGQRVKDKIQWAKEILKTYKNFKDK